MQELQEKEEAKLIKKEEEKNFKEFDKGRERKARSEYKKNVDTKYPIEYILKNFNYSFNTDYERAHIKAVKQSRNNIQKILKEDPNNRIEINKHYKEISDFNNFLPLPKSLHLQHDKGNFAFDTNGHLIKISKSYTKQQWLHIEETLTKHNLLPLPKRLLTKKRIEYLEQHLKYLRISKK